MKFVKIVCSIDEKPAKIYEFYTNKRNKRSILKYFFSRLLNNMEMKKSEFSFYLKILEIREVKDYYFSTKSTNDINMEVRM